MDPLLRILIRMSLMARRKQSTAYLITALVAVGVVLLCVAVQWAGVWPESWTASRPGRIR